MVGPSRQLTNAQVFKGPEGLELMLCVRIPKQQLDHLGKFMIGLDVAEENVNVSCQGAAVPTVSLQTATPATSRACGPVEERPDRSALESAEKRAEGRVVGPASVSASWSFQLKDGEEQQSSGQRQDGGVLGAGKRELELGGGGRPFVAQRGACRQSEARKGELHEEEDLPQPLEEEPVPAIRVSPRRKQRIARERKAEEQQMEPLPATRVSPRRKQQVVREGKGDGDKASGGGQPEYPLQVLAPPCKQGPVVEPPSRKRQWLARQRPSTEARLPGEEPGAPKHELQQVQIRPWCGPLLGAHQPLPTKTRLARQRPSVGEQPPLQQQASTVEASPVAELPSERKQSAEGPTLSAHQQPEKERAQDRVVGQSLGIRQGRPQVQVGPWSGPLLAARHSLLSKMRLARERPSIEEQPPNQQQEDGPLEASPLAELLSKGKQQSALGNNQPAEKPQPGACQQPWQELTQGQAAPQAAGQSLGIQHPLPEAAVPLLAREKLRITRQSSGEQQQHEDVPPPPESSPRAELVQRPWLARERRTTAEQCPSGSGLLGKESPQQPGPEQGVPMGSCWQLPPVRVPWFTKGSIRGPKEKQQEAEELPQGQVPALAMEPEEEPSSVVNVLPLRKQRVARVRRCTEQQPLSEQRRSSAYDTGPDSGEEQAPSERLQEAREKPSLRPAPVLVGAAPAAGTSSSLVVEPKMKLRSASKKPGAGDLDEELKQEMPLLDVRVVLPRCTEVPVQLSAGTKRTLPEEPQAGPSQQQARAVPGPAEGLLPRKRPRLDKQQLRELFAESSDSEDGGEEQEEEGQPQPQPQPQQQHKCVETVLALSQDCVAVTQAAGNAVTATQAVKKALARLSGLSTKKAVRPDELSSIVGRLPRDQLVLSTLAYLTRTQANPQAAFCRQEQAPPLVTRVESLVVQALALYPGGQRAMLSAVRARLWSPQRPHTLHGQAAYVRLACALCRELHEPALARVLTWDLLSSSQAPFLVAAAVGAWPKMLAAFPKGPVRKTLSYVLLRSPVHSLNSTLVMQARQVLRQLGPLAPVEDNEQQLATELLRPLLNPHRCTAMLADACLMHRLCLEELCRRSPGGLLPWLMCQQLAPQLSTLVSQPQASCLLRLLGALTRIYFGDVSVLEPLLQQLEVILLNGEPMLQQLAAEALLRVPNINVTRWAPNLRQWWLERRQREGWQREQQPAHPPVAAAAQATPGPAGLRTSPRTAAPIIQRGAQQSRMMAGPAASR